MLPLHIEFAILDTFDNLEELARAAAIATGVKAKSSSAASAAAAKGKGKRHAEAVLKLDQITAVVTAEVYALGPMFPRYGRSLSFVSSINRYCSKKPIGHTHTFPCLTLSCLVLLCYGSCPICCRFDSLETVEAAIAALEVKPEESLKEVVDEGADEDDDEEEEEEVDGGRGAVHGEENDDDDDESEDMSEGSDEDDEGDDR